MGRTIGTYVTVLDEESGKRHQFVPGDLEDDIPDHLLSKLTNPKVWERPIIGTSNVMFDTGTPDYETSTVPQLLTMIRDRGLNPNSSRKADLIIALMEADDIRS